VKKLILILSIITAGVSAPAYQGDIEFKQSDGTKFIGNLKGDEWFHWVEDKQNHIIKYNSQSKNYEYALLEEINGTIELLPSGSKVADSTANRSSANIPSIDRSRLMEIWKRKRNKANSILVSKLKKETK